MLRHLLALEKNGWFPEGGPVAEPFAALEPQERALAERLSRGMLQNLRILDWLLARGEAFDPARTGRPLQWVMRLAVYQHVFLGGVPDYAICQQAVEQARRFGGGRAGGFVNATLRRLLPGLPGDVEALERLLAAEASGTAAIGLRCSVPDDVAEAYRQAYGPEHAEPVLRAMGREETRVWLRVNALRADLEKARGALDEEGCQTESALGQSGVEIPNVLRWTGGKAPWQTSAWARGWITVQDLGAMPAVWLLDPKPGERVLDFCAAPGGKLGQLWELMEGQGQLTGQEVDARRFRLLEEAAGRLFGPAGERPSGLRLVSSAAGAAEAKVEATPRSYDAILVDAPCLALGLIRRHPEIRWAGRLQEKEAIRANQLSVLRGAAALSAPGARLVWVVCSPTRWELEELVEAFLSEATEWRVVDPRPSIPDWALPWMQLEREFARTRPDLAPVDAFGMALLVRG